VIASPQTVVHFVTLLEEMPVQETLDGIAELQEVGNGRIRPGGVMVNMMREAELAGAAAPGRASLGSKARDSEALEIVLKAAGLGDDAGLAADLADELADEARTARSQRALRRQLDEAGQPCYELPLITDGIDLAALYKLAQALREQGAA
jgi:hypothetical protein